MIVVADTGPLNYLIQIDCDHLLPKLYKRILVPAGVMQELDHTSAPASVRAWLAHIPSWMDVCPTADAPDAELADLDLGEREAIQLAEEQHADLLLMDERKGRRRAKQRGLRTTGTLGVFVECRRAAPHRSRSGLPAIAGRDNLPHCSRLGSAIYQASPALGLR